MSNLPENMQGKVVLVSGAAGFIPSHLAEFYLKLGASVIGIDNFITGSTKNIELLKNKYPHPRFTFHEVNIIDKLPDFSNEKIDYIFSLASPASPIDFKRIPLEILRVNSEGVFKLLNLALEKGARFLQASTSEVYGDPEIHPQIESYCGRVSIMGPRACYDESKRFAEVLTSNYAKKYNLQTRIVRIFNTYGPRMRPNDGRVIPNFINQALKDEDLTVYGDGNQTRSFCFVDDLVEAIHNVMFCNDPTPFNIGNPDEKTILETAKLIIKFLNSSSKIKFSPLPQDDPIKRRPCLDKLFEHTSFRPKISFAEGIEKTTAYFSLK